MAEPSSANRTRTTLLGHPSTKTPESLRRPKKLATLLAWLRGGEYFFKKRELNYLSLRLTCSSGTGVGLVNEDLPAGDIVREVRETAKKRIQEIQAFAV